MSIRPRVLRTVAVIGTVLILTPIPALLPSPGVARPVEPPHSGPRVEAVQQKEPRDASWDIRVLVEQFATANPDAPPGLHLQAALAVMRNSGPVLSPALLMSWLWEESRLRYDAVSPAEALGVSQIRPETGKWIAGELLEVEWEPDRLVQDPAYAIDLGVAYLRWLYQRYRGDLHRTFTAYNRGPGGLEEYIAEHGTPVSRYSSCILTRVGMDDGERCRRTPEQEGE